ncbi:leucyl aminopeptidase [Corynebacterium heidelbergense]|uniref:Probable cytosol aminopeptidase n=1 Tax=Corynebacterium heidelbergense TaxID=2055947 RepID=A0A364VD33_9CORY|nr:leucyl aminopeptidase [Corynebacterium heidelbergense]RAV34565.1 leucyl aminopeptidase [Corynebacterium heidelbergense]WCZ36328.1 Cytosol aminopeptidase [Corynebacterium heidelbergense]
MTEPTAELPARGTTPTVTLAEDPEAIAAGGEVDTLIVPVFTGETGIELAGSPAGLLSQDQEIALWKWLVSVGAKGEREEITTVPGVFDSASQGGFAARRIIAVGLGDAEDVDEEDVREAAGVVARKVKSDRRVLSTLGMLGAEAAALGHALGGYDYRGQRSPATEGSAETDTAPISTDGADATRTEITVLCPDAPPEAQRHVDAIVRAVCLARDLVNTPANTLYPESYANIARALAERGGLAVEILDETQLAKQGFGGILGVGQGSARPPRLLRLSYTPDSGDDVPHVALVGKGVTFDTGGISIKPAQNMWDMISDMGGSAAVIAATLAIAELGLPLRVTTTVPMAENMPGDNAIRPGDVLRHYGGTTVEVLNTDAEGRLILGDAIARACEDEPDFLIETATLTGAQIVALGNRTPGIMGSIAFRDKVAAISQDIGENGWAMPLPIELGEALKSDVADLQNISKNRWGGMSVAGHYLSHFVADGIQWVHMDVAGPAYNTGAAHGYTPKRATGVPVRTIIATCEALARGE